jgi:hypothetical protein
MNKSALISSQPDVDRKSITINFWEEMLTKDRKKFNDIFLIDETNNLLDSETEKLTHKLHKLGTKRWSRK